MHALHSSLRDRARHLILPALILAGTSMSADFARRANDSAAVHPLFDLSTPAGSPSPSDHFTVADPDQNTGRRVALPMPADCVANQSDCEDLGVINTLDGFNMQPRLSIPFDGSIDINSVTNRTVFLISLGDALDPHDSDGQVVGINQVVWDTFTNTLHVESDELLNQHARYALIVTTGVRDASGEPVEASESFRRFRSHVRGEYKHDLLDAIHAARRIGVGEDAIVPTTLPSMSSDSTGSLTGVSAPSTRVCWLKVMPVTWLRGNTVRAPRGPRVKSAGSGVPALIWSRICSRTAVELCVVKTLAVTISSSPTPIRRAAWMASSSACLYSPRT